MKRHPTLFCAIALTLIGSGDRACEDKHPPAVTTPSETFNLYTAKGDNALTLAFDPRGTGRVAPAGDNADRWTDSSDADGAWDYREWQWWKDQPWGDSCRPRYYAQVAFRAPRKSHEVP